MSRRVRDEPPALVVVYAPWPQKLLAYAIQYHFHGVDSPGCARRVRLLHRLDFDEINFWHDRLGCREEEYDVKTEKDWYQSVQEEVSLLRGVGLNVDPLEFGACPPRLVSKLAPLNESDDGLSLHSAVQSGNLELVERLIMNEADLGARISEGNLPAHYVSDLVGDEKHPIGTIMHIFFCCALGHRHGQMRTDQDYSEMENENGVTALARLLSALKPQFDTFEKESHAALKEKLFDNPKLTRPQEYFLDLLWATLHPYCDESSTFFDAAPTSLGCHTTHRSESTDLRARRGRSVVIVLALKSFVASHPALLRRASCVLVPAFLKTQFNRHQLANFDKPSDKVISQKDYKRTLHYLLDARNQSPEMKRRIVFFKGVALTLELLGTAETTSWIESASRLAGELVAVAEEDDNESHSNFYIDVMKMTDLDKYLEDCPDDGSGVKSLSHRVVRTARSLEEPSYSVLAEWIEGVLMRLRGKVVTTFLFRVLEDGLMSRILTFLIDSLGDIHDDIGAAQAGKIMPDSPVELLRRCGLGRLGFEEVRDAYSATNEEVRMNVGWLMGNWEATSWWLVAGHSDNEPAEARLQPLEDRMRTFCRLWLLIAHACASRATKGLMWSDGKVQWLARALLRHTNHPLFPIFGILLMGTATPEVLRELAEHPVSGPATVPISLQRALIMAYVYLIHPAAACEVDDGREGEDAAKAPFYGYLRALFSRFFGSAQDRLFAEVPWLQECGYPDMTEPEVDSIVELLNDLLNRAEQIKHPESRALLLVAAHRILQFLGALVTRNRISKAAQLALAGGTQKRGLLQLALKCYWMTQSEPFPLPSSFVDLKFSRKAITAILASLDRSQSDRSQGTSSSPGLDDDDNNLNELIGSGSPESANDTSVENDGRDLLLHDENAAISSDGGDSLLETSQVNQEIAALRRQFGHEPLPIDALFATHDSVKRNAEIHLLREQVLKLKSEVAQKDNVLQDKDERLSLLREEYDRDRQMMREQIETLRAAAEQELTSLPREKAVPVMTTTPIGVCSECGKGETDATEFDETKFASADPVTDKDQAKFLVDSLYARAAGLKAFRKSFCSSICRLGLELHPSDSNYVNELLQNADDLRFGEGKKPVMRFEVIEGGLLVLTNEVGMSPRDLLGLASVGESAKTPSTHIGHKGIGFKSLFRTFSSAKFESGPLSFRFSQDGDIRDEMWMVAPQWCDGRAAAPPDTHSEFTTQLLLSSKPSKDPSSIDARFEALCTTIDPFSILNFKNVQTVSLWKENGVDSREISVEFQPVEVNKPEEIVVRRAKVSVARASSRASANNQVHATSETCFILFERKFEDTASGMAKRLRIAFPENRGARAAAAKALFRSPDDTNLGFPVYVTLPVKNFGFPFLLHGDFDVTTTRSEIAYTDQNCRLRDNAAMFFCSCLDILDNNPELIELTKWELIPRDDLQDSWWGLFVEKIRGLVQPLDAAFKELLPPRKDSPLGEEYFRSDSDCWLRPKLSSQKHLRIIPKEGVVAAEGIVPQFDISHLLDIIITDQASETSFLRGDPNHWASLCFRELEDNVYFENYIEKRGDLIKKLRSAPIFCVSNGAQSFEPILDERGRGAEFFVPFAAQSHLPPEGHFLMKEPGSLPLPWRRIWRVAVARSEKEEFVLQNVLNLRPWKTETIWEEIQKLHVFATAEPSENLESEDAVWKDLQFAYQKDLEVHENVMMFLPAVPEDSSSASARELRHCKDVYLATVAGILLPPPLFPYASREVEKDEMLSKSASVGDATAHQTWMINPASLRALCELCACEPVELEAYLLDAWRIAGHVRLTELELNQRSQVTDPVLRVDEWADKTWKALESVVARDHGGAITKYLSRYARIECDKREVAPSDVFAGVFFEKFTLRVQVPILDLPMAATNLGVQVDLTCENVARCLVAFARAEVREPSVYVALIDSLDRPDPATIGLLRRVLRDDPFLFVPSAERFVSISEIVCSHDLSELFEGAEDAVDLVAGLTGTV